MNTCKRCGADLPAGAKFCARCGEKTEVNIENASAPNVQYAGHDQGRTYPEYGGYAGGPPVPPPYTGYQEKPRKKRWWIPVIIIVLVLAILAGVWFVFGNRIKLLFLSDNQKWQQAEKAASLVPEDSLLYAIRSSSEDLLKKSKTGYEANITFDIKADVLPDEATSILTILSGLRLNVQSKMDYDEANPHFYSRIAVGKRGETSEVLGAEIYDAGDYLVIDLPGVLSKPLAIHKDFLSDSLDDSGGMSISLDDTFGSMGELRNTLGTFSGSELDEIVEDIKEIFIKYGTETELVKGEELTLGGVSQKLDYYDLIVSAEDSPAMIKEIMTYLRDSKSIESLFSDLGKIMFPSDDTSDPYADFVGEINESIDNINRNPNDFRIEVRRKLYVDNKNNATGGEFIITNLAENESVTLSSLHVTDGDKHAQQIVIDSPGGMTLEYLSEYTMKGDLYTGSFSVLSQNPYYEESGKTEVLRGSFSDFGLKKLDQELYPVGTLNLTVKDSGGPFDDDGTISLEYEGKFEDGKLVASVEFIVDAEDTTMGIGIGFDLKPLSESELVFANEVPADFIDLSDEDALMGLMMDESIMSNLMSALEELGIDLNSLMGFDDFDDDF